MADDRRIFHAIASCEIVDKENQIILVSELQKSLEKYKSQNTFLPILDTHSNRSIGRVIEWNVQKNNEGIKCLHIVGEIYKSFRICDTIWSKICNKSITEMSVGGINYNFTKRCNTKGKCADVADNLDLLELSVVNSGVRASNKEARILDNNFVKVDNNKINNEVIKNMVKEIKNESTNDLLKIIVQLLKEMKADMSSANKPSVDNIVPTVENLDTKEQIDDDNYKKTMQKIANDPNYVMSWSEIHNSVRKNKENLYHNDGTHLL